MTTARTTLAITRRTRKLSLGLAVTAALVAPSPSIAADHRPTADPPSSHITSPPRSSGIEHWYCYWKRVSPTLEVYVCDRLEVIISAQP